MKIECMIRKDAEKPIETLAEFLRKFAAVVKYGRTTIYEGDVYYLPYTLVKYLIRETGETYLFLGSRLADDICVLKEDSGTAVEYLEAEAHPDYVLLPKKGEDIVREEVKRKISLNKKMRKIYARYHFEPTSLRTVYLPEQAFYVKGKSQYFLLVDPLLGKVDYKHLGEVEKRFAENYMAENLLP